MSLANLVPVDATVLDRMQDPALLVVALLEEAKGRLAEARTVDLPAVAEMRARAVALDAYLKQRDLGKGAEMDAREIVLRADRRIGELVRVGQEEGAIRGHGDNLRSEGPAGTLGVSSDFFPSNKARVETYAMTDGVPVERFEDVITEARQEGNLSRANVVRKLKPKAKPADRHEVLRKSRRIDSNRIVRETVHALEGLVMGIAYVEIDQLDADQIEGWTASLRSSIKSLQKLVKDIDQ